MTAGHQSFTGSKLIRNGTSSIQLMSILTALHRSKTCFVISLVQVSILLARSRSLLIRTKAVNHRMFVLESSGPDPWESEYTMKAELDTYDQFAIDGTYFQYADKLYHIYSCWYNNQTSVRDCTQRFRILLIALSGHQCFALAKWRIRGQCPRLCPNV